MENKNMGALWVKSGAKGQYMTGNIEINGEKIAVICFLNQKKDSDKHPDWHILKSVPREQQQQNNPLPQRDDEITDEDVPF